MPKYVVTGGAGFIGSALTRLLAGDGPVGVIDNLLTGHAHNLTGVTGATLHHADIRDYAAIAPLVQGADVVFHLAAIPSVNNNSNFAFRIVAEFESTATGTANDVYAANGGYKPGGTISFDMVTISGTPIAALPGMGASGFNTNHQFQLTVTGTPGAIYIIEATTNLSGANWISLATNVSPFALVDTNTSLYSSRFYRTRAAQ